MQKVCPDCDDQLELGMVLTVHNHNTHFLYSHLQEDAGKIDGRTDPSTEMEKNSLGAILAYSTMDRDWVFKLSYIHALPESGQGQNFPVTDILTMGVSHVFR